MDRLVWSLMWLSMMFGVGHHVDHILRHHNVGWPFSDQVTGFSLSLLFYVVMLIGVILTRRGIVGPGFWALLASGGFFLVLRAHFGPFAADRPSVYAAEYGSQIKATLATCWLVLFLACLAASVVYSARRWAVLRQSATPRVAH